MNTKDMSPMEKFVYRTVRREADGNIEGYMHDLRYGGCQSGMVGCMIYYKDTLAFYRRFKSEINKMLSDEEINIYELKGFDYDDTLCLEQGNQNLLAWFAFEETAFRLFPEE